MIATSAEGALLVARSLLLPFGRANDQEALVSHDERPAEASAINHQAKAARFRERASDLRLIADGEVIPYKRRTRHAMADRLDKMAVELDKFAAAAHAQ